MRSKDIVVGADYYVDDRYYVNFLNEYARATVLAVNVQPIPHPVPPITEHPSVSLTVEGTTYTVPEYLFWSIRGKDKVLVKQGDHFHIVPAREIQMSWDDHIAEVDEYISESAAQRAEDEATAADLLRRLEDAFGPLDALDPYEDSTPTALGWWPMEILRTPYFPDGSRASAWGDTVQQCEALLWAYDKGREATNNKEN